MSFRVLYRIPYRSLVMLKQTRNLVLVAIAWGAIIGSARGDGLIFQLPPDGTFCKYAVTMEGEGGAEGEKAKELPRFKMANEGTMTISSVGEVTRSQQKCRWIELKSDIPKGQGYKKLVLKMLIPEDQLTRGKDPLSHCVLTYFDPKPIDEKKLESYIDEGFNRVQYEIDRFRVSFPQPLENSKSLLRETVETPAGKFEGCEVVTGTYDYDGPILGGARSTFKGTYRIIIHPDVPYGVVSMDVKVEGREIHGDFAGNFVFTQKMVLAEVGKNAVSALPEATEKRTNK